MGSEDMELLKFEDYAEIGNYMYETALDGEAISAVLYYDDMIDIMKWLLEYDDIDVGNITIIEEYPHEYYVTLDECLYLNIKPVIGYDGNAIKENVDIMLFDGDVPNSIALCNSDCVQKEISYNEDDFCGDCCADCSSCCHKEATEVLEAALDFLDYLFSHSKD
jgi:hypothetical protein